MFNFSFELLSMFRSAYGTHLEEQNRALDFILNEFKTARFFPKTKENKENQNGTIGKKPKTALLPCQEGFIISIMSLKGLWTYLKEEKNVPFKFLLTSRLNQDCLENYFSQIRMYSKY